MTLPPQSFDQQFHIEGAPESKDSLSLDAEDAGCPVSRLCWVRGHGLLTATPTQPFRFTIAACLFHDLTLKVNTASIILKFVWRRRMIRFLKIVHCSVPSIPHLTLGDDSCNHFPCGVRHRFSGGDGQARFG